MQRRFVMSSVLAVVVGLVGVATPAQALAPLARPQKAGLFCPCWGGPPANDAAWDNAARNLSLIAGNKGTLAKRYARAKQINPNLVMVPYTLGPFLSQNSAEFTRTLRDHPDRFARDADGNLVYPPRFPDNILMDVGNPGWQQQQATIAAAAAKGLDGVYVDSMGIGPVTGYTNAPPVDPNTGQRYTAMAWEAAARDTITAIKAKVGAKYVFFNGLSDGAFYRYGTRLLVDSTGDGGLNEAWMRQARSDIAAYPSPTAFADNLAAMLDVQAKGKQFFAWTKTWTTGTPEQKKAWHNFAFASFLLGDKGQAFFSFVPEEFGDRSTIVHSIDLATIGTPKGDYWVTPTGVYRREFTRASVRVNPATHTASITLR